MNIFRCHHGCAKSANVKYLNKRRFLHRLCNTRNIISQNNVSSCTPVQRETYQCGHTANVYPREGGTSARSTWGFCCRLLSTSQLYFRSGAVCLVEQRTSFSFCVNQIIRFLSNYVTTPQGRQGPQNKGMVVSMSLMLLQLTVCELMMMLSRPEHLASSIQQAVRDERD